MPDFSCTFVVDNPNPSATLMYRSVNIKDGNWHGTGPTNITGRGVSYFKLKDVAGSSRGAEGEVIFSYEGPHDKLGELRFYMSCPLIGNNVAYMDKYTKNGRSLGREFPNISLSGHPLTATFVVPS